MPTRKPTRGKKKVTKSRSRKPVKSARRKLVKSVRRKPVKRTVAKPAMPSSMPAASVKPAGTAGVTSPGPTGSVMGSGSAGAAGVSPRPTGATSVSGTAGAGETRMDPMASQYRAPETIATHTVQDGETLSHIALKYYGNAGEKYYMHIYNANRMVIGDDPNLIKTGQELRIPRPPVE